MRARDQEINQGDMGRIRLCYIRIFYEYSLADLLNLDMCSPDCDFSPLFHLMRLL